jgi:phosphatidate phosphatase PAH1
MQLADSTYDPLERGEASELITDYHARGFFIVYLTARAEIQYSLDDAMIPARELTEDWLIDHGFPYDEHTTLVLADAFTVGDTAIAYKTEALMNLQADGLMFDYAYGNADSDIAAYENSGIGKDVTFIIGPEAGNDGTVAVAGEDWITHRAEHLPTVPNYCEG